MAQVDALIEQLKERWAYPIALVFYLQIRSLKS